jgi:drug/metabolite transporter (DMT)-like permease
MVFAVSASVIWGLSFPAIIIGLDDVQPLFFGAIRFLIATPLLVGLTLTLYGKKAFKRTLNEWYTLILLGITGTTAPIILQNLGMQHSTAHVSSILQSTGPIFVVFFAFFFLNEPLTSRKIGGIVLASSGAYFVIVGSESLSSASTLLGNTLVLLSALSYAVSGIIAKSCLKKGYQPVQLLTLSSLPGTFFLLIFAHIFEGTSFSYPLTAWWPILFLALFPSFLALILWFDAMSATEVSRLHFYVYLIPLFATIFSYFLLGEEIFISTVVAASLIILGVALAQS